MVDDSVFVEIVEEINKINDVVFLKKIRGRVAFVFEMINERIKKLEKELV